jgi:hypothetical protein
MATIHLLLQGKGEVGKSFVAAILFQYLRKRFSPVVGYDTDPVNSTFAGYKEFGVTVLNIMKNDDIDPRGFDQLMEALYGLAPEAHAVVDNGASCFEALGSYLKENNALSLLKNDGHEIIIHTLVTGGQALGDTLTGLRSLLKSFRDVPIAVWLNPYFGEIVNDGQSFYEFKVYAEDPEAFRAVVEIPPLKPGTFGRDLEEILAKRWSFGPALIPVCL